MQKLKAVAERLTLPAVLVHFFCLAPTPIEQIAAAAMLPEDGPDVGGGVLDH